MAYQKQNFKAGDVLTSTQLNHMDDQIALNEANINAKKDVTAANIKAVLNYTPANASELGGLSSEIDTKLDKNALAEVESRIDNSKRELDLLWKLNQGISYSFERNSDAAYSKIVPSGAKGVSINSVGAKTLVWNQLVHAKENTKGTKPFLQGTKITKGHKYMFICDFEAADGNAGVTIYIPNDDGTVDNMLTWSIANIGTIKIATADGISDGTVSRIAGNAYYYYNSTVISVDNAQLFDLTTMFGAGNEPTAEEFRTMFPDDYYPYSEPTLMNFEPDSVVSRGRNLLNLDEGWITDKSYAELPLHLEPGTYTLSLNKNLANKYNTPYDSKTYVFLINIGGLTVNYTTKPTPMAYFGHTGTFVSSFQLLNHTFTVTTDASLYAYWGDGKTIPSNYKEILETLFGTIQIARSEIALPYAPYRDPITTDISTLVTKYFPDGMKSTGAVYDEIDLERGVAIKRIGSADLGTLAWIYREQNNGAWRSTSLDPAPAVKALVRFDNAVCDKHIVANNYSNIIGGNPGIGYNGGTGSLWCYTDGTRDKLPDGMLCYELAEPIETKISDEDMAKITTILSVEASGSLTFHNNQEQTQPNTVALPNTIDYIISTKEAMQGA